jgi:hypothetical protein
MSRARQLIASGAVRRPYADFIFAAQSSRSTVNMIADE